MVSTTMNAKIQQRAKQLAHCPMRIHNKPEELGLEGILQFYVDVGEEVDHA